MQKDDMTSVDQQHCDEMLRKLWNENVAEMSDQELDNALDTFREHREVHEMAIWRKRRILKILKYAALFILPVLTAWAAWNYSAEYNAAEIGMEQCYVSKGKIDSLWLSDGTKVIVNAGSSLLYPSSFSKRDAYRKVYVNGSCHFDVTKDPDHPFVVNMGNLKVKVLGTHFSVDSYTDEDKVTVTLEEGLVKVFDKSQSMTLYPNEQLVYDRNDGRMTKSRVDAQAVNSWVNGDIDFLNQPLSEMLKILERRYNVKIHVASGIDLKSRYTMNFKKEEPVENVMRVLSIALGNKRYKKDGNVVLIY